MHAPSTEPLLTFNSISIKRYGFYAISYTKSRYSDEIHKSAILTPVFLYSTSNFHTPFLRARRRDYLLHHLVIYFFRQFWAKTIFGHFFNVFSSRKKTKVAQHPVPQEDYNKAPVKIPNQISKKRTENVYDQLKSWSRRNQSLSPAYRNRPGT